MLPHPERVEALMEVVKDFPEIQCSVKMRLDGKIRGMSEVIAFVEEAPLVAIFLHARVGVQEYKGGRRTRRLLRFLRGV